MLNESDSTLQHEGVAIRINLGGHTVLNAERMTRGL